ncbi:MAG: hypothetical protein WC208_08515 [Gallionella sp.]|jgi:hypothetical protein
MADDRTPQEQIADGYKKAAFDVPYDRELKAMNYKQLAVALEQSKKGSARHSVIALEMEKRKPSLTGINVGWIHRNGTTLLLGFLGSLLASAIWFYYWAG